MFLRAFIGLILFTFLGNPTAQAQRKTQVKPNKRAESNSSTAAPNQINSTQVESKSLNSISALSAQPRLMVGITVDQMRMDYLYRYWDHFLDDGFKRLVRGGMLCADHHFGYAPTYTGPGHASIFTGTTPRFHGIIGNNWFERSSKTSVYCTSDSSARIIGVPEGSGIVSNMSPHRMHASTIGDEMKLASGMRAKVIGVSLKDRGAILPAGHSGDAAYWFYGKDQGIFVSSTHYMDELPKWVKKWNEKSFSSRYLKTRWAPSLSDEAYDKQWPDNNPFEGNFIGSERPTMPYNLNDLAPSNGGFDILKSTPRGNTLMTDFVIQAILKEGLGEDTITDLLAVSYSATDYIGHQFGSHAKETMDAYIKLDHDLARLFKNLDNLVGEKQWTCWLTADHGGATVPSLAASEGLPTEYWKPGNLIDAVNADLLARYGEGNWVLRYDNDQFYLNRPLIRENNLDLMEVQNRVQSLCLEEPGVLMAPTTSQLESGGGGMDDIAERLHYGLHSAASGDVIVVPLPGWINYGLTGTTHGSPFAYDTHVPCIFYGWGVQVGVTYERTYIRDIVPTIAALIHCPLPNACTGRPITSVIRP